MKTKLFCAFSLISSALASAPALAAPPEIMEFSPTFRSSWPHIGRAGTYSYEPSAMIDNDGSWKMWFCTGEPAGAPYSHKDSIYYAKFAAGGGYEIPPTPVLRPNLMNTSSAGWGVCNPSVIRHSFPAINEGYLMYLLYYECAPLLYQTGTGAALHPVFTETCLAFSHDGQTWRPYNEALWNLTWSFGDANTDPTPVVRVDAKIKENCAYYRAADGKQMVDTGRTLCNKDNAGLNYGSGHPSAIVVGNEIWLFYYDSRGIWEERGVFLAKSWDGFHFGAAVKTTLPNGANVKYYPQNGGLFIATTVIGKNNLILYSSDGINWTPSGATGINVGVAKQEHCAAPGYAQIMGDKYGNISSLFINLFSGEGYMGLEDNGPSLGCYDPNENTSRGSSWKIYLIQGLLRPLSNSSKIDAGYFSINQNQQIFYSNGQNSYCAVTSWQNFLWSGGDPSHISSISSLPSAMVFAGSCAAPPIPAGFFMVSGQGTIYYSNGLQHFCALSSWQTFLDKGGQQNLSNVAKVPSIPANMTSDGVCP